MDTANAEPDGPQLGNVHERHIVWIIVAHLPRMSRHSFCSIFRRSALRCIRVRSYTVSFLMRSSELKSLHESRLARSSASLKRYRIGKQLEAPGSTRPRLTHLTHALSAHPERAPADWLDVIAAENAGVAIGSIVWEGTLVLSHYICARSAT